MHVKLKYIPKGRSVYFILLFIIRPLLIDGQVSNLPESHTNSIRIINQAIYNCKVQFPDNYNPNNGYPVLIALHGGGGSYETFMDIWTHFADPQLILATPQAPYKWLLGDQMGYDWAAWPSNDTSYMKEAIVLTSKYIETIITNLKSRYKVENIYLLGFSQGSIIAQIAGIDNHDQLKGLIICSGPEMYHPNKPEIIWPSVDLTKRANHLKVFIAHGKDDTIIDLELARKSKDQYSCYGFDVTLYEFEGGHEISKSAMREIQKWMN